MPTWQREVTFKIFKLAVWHPSSSSLVKHSRSREAFSNKNSHFWLAISRNGHRLGVDYAMQILQSPTRIGISKCICTERYILSSGRLFWRHRALFRVEGGSSGCWLLVCGRMRRGERLSIFASSLSSEPKCPLQMHPLLETDASRYSAPGHAFLRLPTRLPRLLEKALQG
jgi:hypothetical protein